MIGVKAATDENQNASPLLSATLKAIDIEWRAAITRAQHPRGCSCCGGLAFLLDPGALAEDIEHSLRQRQACDPVRLLDDHPPRPGEPFPARLARIAAAGDPDTVGKILSDALETIHSIGEAARPLRLRMPGASRKC